MKLTFILQINSALTYNKGTNNYILYSLTKDEVLISGAL